MTTPERGSTPLSLASKPAADTDPHQSHSHTNVIGVINASSRRRRVWTGRRSRHREALRHGGLHRRSGRANLDRLRGGADRSVHDGVTAHPYVGEVGNPDSIRSTLQAIRSDHGPISMIALTAYLGSDVNDVLSAQPEQIGQAFDIGVTGLFTITQASLPDLEVRSRRSGARAQRSRGRRHARRGPVRDTVRRRRVALECAATSRTGRSPRRTPARRRHLRPRFNV